MFSHQKGSFCVLRGCPKSLKIAFADCPLPSEGGTGVGFKMQNGTSVLLRPVCLLCLVQNPCDSPSFSAIF